ncbi:hypothetical protein BDQ17DRAFT_1364727, partial [Cyathus striatus]
TSVTNLPHNQQPLCLNGLQDDIPICIGNHNGTSESRTIDCIRDWPTSFVFCLVS